jgi:5'-deoxynucleotidase YfbR-like HD superfamily hydrolase
MLGREYPQPEADIALLMRVKLLSEVKRYAGMEMVHRPDLFTHTYRTARLATSMGYQMNILPSGKHHFDLPKLHRMGMRHDDAEFITGDIVAPAKRALTPEETALLKSKEQEGVHALAHFFYGFRTQAEQEQYLAEQEEVEAKQTPEAQLLNVADKWDALGEIVHDIRCGNENFSSLLPFSRKTFQKFHEYPFWDDLGGHVGFEFNDLESDRFTNHIAEARRLTIDDLPTPESVPASMHSGWYPDWPMAYRNWMQVSKQTFHLRPEKYIFPGWYMELWKRWDYRPSGSSTLSGIVIP